MILYFDVFIVDENYSLQFKSNNRRAITENKIQSSCHAYRKRKKIDITKYTLASYAILKWEHVIIRYECENESQTEPFFNYCRELFPHADIYCERSDTAAKYVYHLNELKIYGNPWVYFSPNNDHPYICSSLGYLEKMLEVAEDAEKNNIYTPVSVLYSHFTESINTINPSKYLWGEYAFIFPKTIAENDFSITLKMNKYVCDSIQIYRLNNLINIFKDTRNNGRVIRIEDTEFYLNKDIKNIIVMPKHELCRHYDGYFHHDIWRDVASAPPPLIIPEGFFENKISIRYGYLDYIENFVNINPIVKSLKYIDINGVDLKCAIHEIPLFWKNKIIKIDINPNLDLNAEVLALKINRENLINPWKSIYLINVIRSYFRFIIFPFKFSYQFLRIFLFKKYGTKGIYRQIVKIRDKYFGFPY